jgi:hypothetical protein
MNMGGKINQMQRISKGALTSRGGGPSTSLAATHLLQNQQMIPSNYTNQANQNEGLNQDQSEKIKSYSRKLAKLVSSGVIGANIGGGSVSNSRTPISKKKVRSS